MCMYECMYECIFIMSIPPHTPSSYLSLTLLRYIKNPVTKVRSIFGPAKKGVRYDQLSSTSSHGGDNRNYRENDEFGDGRDDVEFNMKNDGDDASTVSEATSISAMGGDLKRDSKGSFSIVDDSSDDDSDDNHHHDTGIEMLFPQKGEIETNENNPDGTVIVLDRISLSIASKSLVAVCGSTGSGKSTFIAGLLGECKTMGGGVMMNGELDIDM
jgi:ABC-type multidrug transport system fused ATPase/permease subunit